MSGKFISDWSRPNKASMSQSIRDKLHPVPFRDRLSQTIFRLNSVRKKLENSHLKMEQKHKTLFHKTVQAQEAKNSTTAVMYANECAQVRKMAQSIVASQLALEQVVLRLETVTDFGDIAAEIGPTASIVRAVRGRLAGVVPEVSMQLGSISQTLDSLVLETGQATEYSWSSIASGEEAEKILAEAGTIAEQKIRDGFPELPSTAAEKGLRPL